MTFNAIMFFTHRAESIKKLADRLFMHPDITDTTITNMTYSWYNGPEKTGDDLGNYLATEQNREKIAVLLEFISTIKYAIDYERVYLKIFETANVGAIAELVRFGCHPPSDDVLAKGNNREMIRLHCTKDINLESKYRNPRIRLNRLKHPIALSQAYYLLKTDSKSTPDMIDLFDLAIKSNNKRAFFYLIHSNMEFDVSALAFFLIDHNNTECIKEMCRQGYKFDMKNKDDQIAILYAVGKIAPEDFGCFFYKAGRLDAEIDRDLLLRLDSMMPDCQAVKEEMSRKPMNQIPIFNLNYNSYPNVDHNITRTNQMVSRPIYAYKAKTLDHLDDTNPFQLLTTINGSTKYYQLTEKIINTSGVLSGIFDGVSNGDEPTEVPVDIQDTEAFEILLSFMIGISNGELYDCKNGCPQWLQDLLGGSNMELIFKVFAETNFLDVFKFYNSLGYFMNKLAKNKTTEELRYIISDSSSMIDFSKIDFSTYLKPAGLGAGDV